MWSGLEEGRKATEKRVIWAREYFRALPPAQERVCSRQVPDLSRSSYSVPLGRPSQCPRDEVCSATSDHSPGFCAESTEARLYERHLAQLT